MRKTLGVCLLALLLTGSTSAGEMPNLSPAPPPPQTTNATNEPMAEGEMQNGGTDTLTQFALAVLVSVLP